MVVEIMCSDDDRNTVGIREQGKDIALTLHTNTELGERTYLFLMECYKHMGFKLVFFDKLGEL